MFNIVSIWTVHSVPSFRPLLPLTPEERTTHPQAHPSPVQEETKNGRSCLLWERHLTYTHCSSRLRNHPFSYVIMSTTTDSGPLLTGGGPEVADSSEIELTDARPRLSTSASVAAADIALETKVEELVLQREETSRIIKRNDSSKNNLDKTEIEAHLKVGQANSKEKFKTVIGTKRSKPKSANLTKHVDVVDIFADPSVIRGAGSHAVRITHDGQTLREENVRIAGGDFEDTLEEHAVDQANVAGVRGEAPGDGKTKFGTWDGVFVSCLLNIFGVIMFLRLGWVVGQAGIIQALLIILLGGVITSLTTASMAAIATNGTVRGGGAYFMISRALGPEIGGTIGVLFFLGLCVAVSMYVIGFCETLVENMGVCPNVYDENGMLTLCDPSKVKFTFFGCTGPTFEDMAACKLNDIRVYGILLMVILLIMALIGTGWVIKMQIGLFALLVCTIMSFCLGTFNHNGEADNLNGFVGWGGTIKRILDVNGTSTLIETGQDNLANMLHAQYTTQKVGGVDKDFNFFKVFSIFFPAVTGIMAGANISGMLKDPAKNITVGTFSAIGVSTLVYMLMAFFIGATIQRTQLLNDYYVMMKVELAKSVLESGQIIGWLVLIGVYAATFSSALASLVGAPQMLFNVAKDRIIPICGFFATTHRPTCWSRRSKRFCNKEKKPFCGCFEPITSELNDAGVPTYTDTSGHATTEADPVFGYFITFLVACGCILIGDLNFVAPLISMFFMLTYGLLNLSCFFLSYYETPGWRPTFKYFHWSTALLATVLCLIAMFLTDVTFAPVSIGIAALLTFYISTIRVKTNWGTALDGRAYTNATDAIFHLRNIRLHIKTFRPSYVVLTSEKIIERDASAENSLARYLYTLRKGGGCVFWGRIIEDTESRDLQLLRERYEDSYKCLTPGEETDENTKYAPLDVIRSPTFFGGALALLQGAGIGNLRPNTMVIPFFENWQTVAAEDNGADGSEHALLSGYVNTIAAAQKMRFGTMITRNLDSINWRQPKAKHTVDVWWLIDDGGLAMLVPYIMSQAPFWRSNTDDLHETTVRLFFIYEGNKDATSMAAFGDELKNNRELVRKFRFDFEIMDPEEHDLFMVKQDGSNPEGGPSKRTIEDFNSLNAVTLDEIGNDDVVAATKQWLRVSEIIRENCPKRFTKMVYMTMPHPRSFIPPKVYLGWLEILSMNMPPVVFIKGNSKDCLTYFLE